MESELEVYHRPYHTDFPVFCLDENPKQLVKETIESMAAELKIDRVESLLSESFP